MKVKWDKEADVVYIQLKGLLVNESSEDKPGIILDYAKDGRLVAIEILNASKTLPHTNKFEYEIT